LIEELWDSIEVEASDPLSFERLAPGEIDRHLDALGFGASVGAPWFHVRTHLTRGA
jgi:hypothetical protein